MSAVTKHSSDIFRLLADPRWKKNSQPPLCSSNPPPFCSRDIISSKMLRIKMRWPRRWRWWRWSYKILEERDASSLFIWGQYLPLCKAMCLANNKECWAQTPSLWSEWQHLISSEDIFSAMPPVIPEKWEKTGPGLSLSKIDVVTAWHWMIRKTAG